MNSQRRRSVRGYVAPPVARVVTTAAEPYSATATSSVKRR